MKRFCIFPILVSLEIWQIALIIGGALLFACAIIVIFIILKRKKSKPFISDDWFMALGGNENIKEISAVGSRLSLVLKDKEAIAREKLKTLGVSSVLVMSNKVTLVIEGEAERIANSIKSSL